MNQEVYPAAGIVTIFAALARAMAQDCALGVTDGYVEAVMLVERGLAFICNDEMPGETKTGP